MGLENVDKMLQKAFKNGYAVPQFNINNLEWTKWIIEVCEENKCPVILGVSEGAAKYFGGFNTVVHVVKGIIADKKPSIPIAIHLDHGSSFESCKAALEAGFTSVMIDGSALPIDGNIELTKKVVELAKKYKATVEAELGIIGGEEDGKIGEGVIYADHDEAIKLSKSGITMLAPALGSVHGDYDGEPNLGFDEMKAIADDSKMPLVLHGGSGIPDDQIKKAIARGTAKINVNTENQTAWAQAVRDKLSSDDKVRDPRKVIGAGEKALKEVCLHKMTVFGSKGQA